MLVEVQAGAIPGTSGGGTGVRAPAHAAQSLDRASTLSHQILHGRYQVLQKLGEGGMSYVYLAKEISSGDTVAIKILSPRLASDKSSVERLRREAGLAMRLAHPNVCRILRLGESEDGLIYLVMP
ncbi:MAG: protein kinase domain-containing protein, partial [Gemmatimonadales bacterium]